MKQVPLASHPVGTFLVQYCGGCRWVGNKVILPPSVVPLLRPFPHTRWATVRYGSVVALCVEAFRHSCTAP